MNIIDAKNILITIVLSQEGLSRDGNYIESISESIHKGNFLAEGKGQILTKFFTWKEDEIDGKLYIFLNNLYIHPSVRNKDTLISIRSFIKKLYPNVYQGYWYNKRRDCLKYRS